MLIFHTDANNMITFSQYAALPQNPGKLIINSSLAWGIIHHYIRYPTPRQQVNRRDNVSAEVDGCALIVCKCLAYMHIKTVTTLYNRIQSDMTFLDCSKNVRFTEYIY
jgi:hypothetical protein